MSNTSAERAVAVLAIAAFGSSASLRCTDALLPLLAAEFSTTVGGAAGAITAFSVAYGLLQVVHGPLGDKLGKYRLSFLTTLVSTFGTLACALAPTLDTLVVARFVAGATVGAIIPLSMAWIGDVVPYANRQAVLARFLIGQMLGVACGASFGGFLGEHFGWRSPFYLLSGFYAIVSVLLWLQVSRNPHTRVAAAAAPVSILEGLGRMAGLLRDPWVRTVLAMVTAEAALFNGSLAFIALHLHRNLGLSLGVSGTLIGLYAVGGVLYASVSKKLVRRLGEQGLALAGGIAIGIGFLGLIVSKTVAFVPPCLLILGSGLYMLHNTLQVHATQMAPDSRGAALAVFAFSLFSGQSFGIWLGSRVVDAAGTLPLFLVTAVGLPLLGLEFRRRLRQRAASA